MHRVQQNQQLSYECAATEVSAHPFVDCEACWVHVDWFLPDSQKGCNRIVDLDELEDNQDVTVEEGAALGSEEFFLKIGKYIVIVKYSFDNPIL